MQLQPVLVEGQALVVVADGAEAVDVALADAAPIHELDTELERAAYGAHEFDLVDLQRGVERTQVRNGGFTDSHGADVIGLDERDGTAVALERMRERGGGHPSCRAAAHDDNVSQS